MMWPILTKVQYESLHRLFTTRNLYIHILLSLFLNWIIGPLIMLALAWATLPDLPTYRAGVIMVGLARCIAMVMIWNQLARGDSQYCAILVVINSVLQIILYSPYSLLFVNIIGGGNNASEIRVDYGDVAISVLIVSASYVVTVRTTHQFFHSTLASLLHLVLLHVSSCSPSLPATSFTHASYRFSRPSRFSGCSTLSSSCLHTKDTISYTILGLYSVSLCQ